MGLEMAGGPHFLRQGAECQECGASGIAPVLDGYPPQSWVLSCPLVLFSWSGHGLTLDTFLLRLCSL